MFFHPTIPLSVLRHDQRCLHMHAQLQPDPRGCTLQHRRMRRGRCRHARNHGQRSTRPSPSTRTSQTRARARAPRYWTRAQEAVRVRAQSFPVPTPVPRACRATSCRWVEGTTVTTPHRMLVFFFFLSFCCCCSALTEEDFYRILTVPTNNLIKQQVALLNTSVHRAALQTHCLCRRSLSQSLTPARVPCCSRCFCDCRCLQ